MSPSVAYLGPEQTNSHLAALRLFPQGLLQPLPTISAIFEAVSAGSTSFGVVPVENSTGGTVRETVDALLRWDPRICQEFEMAIENHLLGLPGANSATAKRVLSHPQALSQCRGWLDRAAPHLERVECSSTGWAAQRAAEDPDTLAIANALAAEASGLVILKAGISDRSDNSTRFLTIAPEDAPPSDNPDLDKTSLVFVAPHRRGGLRQVLTVFDEAGVNLMRIESRPLADPQGKKWEYAFIVDAVGHRLSSPLREAIDTLEAMKALVKVLGSYPQARDFENTL